MSCVSENSITRSKGKYCHLLFIALPGNKQNFYFISLFLSTDPNQSKMPILLIKLFSSAARKHKAPVLWFARSKSFSMSGF